MNLIRLSWKYIIERPLNTFLNVLLFGFGISIIIVLLLVAQQFKSSLSKNAKGINLVVAAKGSPLQIILCNIYHIDFPTGNIPLKDAIKLSNNRLIKKSIPLALGDSYKNFRLVGTTHAYTDLYKVQVGEGKLWSPHEEVTLGVNVAEQLQLKVGDTFHSEHGLQSGGLAHDEHHLTVVGILDRSGTVLDNLILTSIENIWELHGTHDESSPHHEDDEISTTALGISFHQDELEQKEITSLIIQYAGPMGAVRLPRMINSQTNMQSASPAYETTRLFSLVGVGVDVLNGFAYLIILIAALSIFISLYNSLKQRAYDLAIMRSMGASKRFLLFHVIIESLIISFLGGIFGLFLAHFSIWAIDYFFIPTESQMHVSPLIFSIYEIIIVGLSFVVGFIASLLPAIGAYKTDISKTLAKG